jgi:hypothetical protein
MLPAILYFATAIAILAVARRWVSPVSPPAAVVLVLLPLTFTVRTLLTERVMAPVDIQYLSEPFYGVNEQAKHVEVYNPEMLDLATQMVPWRAALRESLGKREWPLLNPHILSGDVLAAAGQPAAYSPFTLIALLATPVESFDYTGAIAFFLAALGAFLFARDLGCGEVACIFGAAAFAFNGPFAFAILWPLGFSWALLPLVMLGARRVVRERSIALLTVALVLEILAGHPESTLHVVALGAVWGLFEGVRSKVESGRRTSSDSKAYGCRATFDFRPDPLRPLAAGLLALGLTAIYLLPLLDAASQTAEHHFRQTVFAKSKRAAPANEIGAGILTTLFPVLHQQKWLAPMRTPAFIGIGSLVLAAMLASLHRARDATTWMLFALFIVCAAAALMAPPVSSLLHALPLFDVALNERLLFGASFCAAMLAARGLSLLGWRTTAVVFALLAAGSYLVTHAGLTDGHVTKFRQYALLGELLPLGLALLLVFQWGDRRPRLSSIALVALLLSQRLMEDGRWYPALQPDIAFPPLALPQTGDRVVGKGMAFLPNSGALYGLDDVRGYEAMTLRTLSDTYPLWGEKLPAWFNRVDDLTAPMLSMMNVRWAIARREETAPEGWRLVRPGLMENLHVLPRAFVPRNVRRGIPENLVLPEMRGERDFGERAWIGAPMSPHPPPAPSPQPGEVPNGPGIVTNDVADMANDGWVVVSQANWRGWRAWVDGRRVTVYSANHAFLAVWVPRGRHALRFAFRPQSFVIGRTVTFASLLLVTVIILVHLRRGTIPGPLDAHHRRLQQSQ